MDYILKENRKITKIVFLSLGFYNKITWTKKNRFTTTISHANSSVLSIKKSLQKKQCKKFLNELKEASELSVWTQDIISQHHQ